MPGLAGAVRLSGRLPLEDLVSTMGRTLQHEPFYTSGAHVDDTLGVGVAWSVISGGFDDCLPIRGNNSQTLLFFVGEDYRDRAEIAGFSELGERKGAEYLACLFDRNGLAAIPQLNGRFAGVYIDKTNQSVALFTDRYGLGRIYVCEREGVLFFSTEAKAILQVDSATRSFDPQGLADFFAVGCTLDNRSLFNGISVFPAASVWVVTDETVRKRRYWDPQERLALPKLADDRYYAQLKETWKRVLPMYLRADDRIALSLTGGKDSRMIMAWLDARPDSVPCYTFASRFRDTEDVTLARRISGLCEQPHSTIEVGDEFLSHFAELASRTVYLTDGVMDVSGAPDLYVNSIAREIAPIRLTGNYGQEVLRADIAFKPLPLSQSVFGGGVSALMAASVARYAELRRSDPLLFILSVQLPWHHYSRLSLELSQLSVRSPYIDNAVVDHVLRASPKMVSDVELQLRVIRDGYPRLVDIQTDRGLGGKKSAAMAALSNAYREFTFKAEYAYDYGMPNWMVRLDKSLAFLHLERLFLGRHKFYHFRTWYRGPLAPTVRQVLLDPAASRRPYLNRAEVERIVEEHVAGRANHTLEIHRLLTTEIIERRLLSLHEV